MFAKNVPKPKVAKNPTLHDASRNQDVHNSDLNAVEEEKESDFYTGLGGPGTTQEEEQNTINELDAKHDYYADELEKIKAMLQ